MALGLKHDKLACEQDDGESLKRLPEIAFHASMKAKRKPLSSRSLRSSRQTSFMRIGLRRISLILAWEGTRVTD